MEMGSRLRRVHPPKGGCGAPYDDAPRQVAHAVWLHENPSEDGHDAYPGALRGPRRGDRRKLVPVQACWRPG
jgi:hypothetical protein